LVCVCVSWYVLVEVGMCFGVICYVLLKVGRRCFI